VIRRKLTLAATPTLALLIAWLAAPRQAYG
jgi:hypothetical protein